MADKQKTILDQENYYQLSKPFDSPAEAEAAVEAFWQELYALRNKHKLPDVYVILAIPIRYEDGDVGNVMARLHAGDELRAESMVAWAFGREGAMRQERTAKIEAMGAAIKARPSKK